MRTAFVLLALVCMGPPLRGQWAQIGWEPVAAGFNRPVFVTGAGDGSGRLFVVEQEGRVKIWRDGATVERPFLDLTARVGFDEELGLFSIAFPPHFADKKRVYAFFVEPGGGIVIARYRVDGDVADAKSEEVVLRFAQPLGQHNGGTLAFSPVDGKLYVSVGDGGIGVEADDVYVNDPDNAGQNPGVWQGKILRLDVESEGVPYVAPADNPRREGWLPEVWSIGWRNPWRFSFDRKTGDMWVGDVGADGYEEIDMEPVGAGGRNYGWSLREGTHCVPGKGCGEVEGLTAPAIEYGHDEGCSVTGGVVYRGSRFRDVEGTYIFGDYCRGQVWAAKQLGGEWRRVAMGLTRTQLVSFGEDDAGEIYLVDYRGSILRLMQLAPGLSVIAVGNGASGEAGMVAGSQVSATLSGLDEVAEETRAEQWPLPLSLADVTVWVNGTQAGVIGVAPSGKVDFLAPYVLPGDSAQVQVRSGFKTSNLVQAAVKPVQPGLFTVDGRHVLAVNEQGEMTKSAGRGTVVAIYGTGLGSVLAWPEYGYPAKEGAEVKGTVRASIGGKAGGVQFAALAPGFAGIYAVVVKIAEDAELGEGDVWVEVEGIRSLPVRFTVE
ncbi:MAG: PQQ-dependent sugar dehydrogenase [Bryobacterales bacterium]|nr:PQQ-dependent sugar dehydrogenase [Bryobacterales bacterium]